MGTKSKWLNVKEKTILNKGVHFCATCGPIYQGKIVCVIGSIIAAESYLLTSVTKEVLLLSPQKELSADSTKQKCF